MVSRHSFYTCLFLLSGLLSLDVAAQVTTQSVPLSAGWNAVYLEVQPGSAKPSEVFASLPEVTAVWMWNPPVSSVQAIDSVDSLVPGNPQWLVYIPNSQPNSSATNLFKVFGGRTYLIQVGGDSPVTLTVKGRPVFRKLQWVDDSFNLVGAPVDATNGPTFAEFFSSSSSLTGQAIYRMDPVNGWVKEANPSTTKMKRGEAFWIYSKGHTEYQGPLALDLDFGDGLTYGDSLTELTVTLSNTTSSPIIYNVKPGASEPNPELAGLPPLAGSVPLAYWRQDYELANSCSGQDCWKQYVGWQPLGEANITVEANSEHILRLAVLRTEMAAVAKQAKAAGDLPLHQSTLVVGTSDGKNTISIPVTAQRANDASTNERAGLWVGEVTVTRVTEHNPGVKTIVGGVEGEFDFAPQDIPAGQGIDESDEQRGARCAGGEFPFRILVHVDGAGTPRLVQQVTQMWQNNGTPANPLPGQYVLFTDETYKNDPVKYIGATQNNGENVGRRISAPNFGFTVPICAVSGAQLPALTAAPPSGAVVFPDCPAPASPRQSGVTGQASFQVDLAYNDPLNPFFHRYHPDHDNLNAKYDTEQADGVESYSVLRTISLTFTADDPERLSASLSGWGDDQLGGVYEEVIEGLHKDNIAVRGTFRLTRITDIPELLPEIGCP